MSRSRRRRRPVARGSRGRRSKVAPLGLLIIYLGIGLAYSIAVHLCFNITHYRDRAQYHPTRPDVVSYISGTLFWPGNMIADFASGGGITKCKRHPL